MNNLRFLALAVATVLAVATAIALLARPPVRAPEPAPVDGLLSQLGETINDVDRIRLSGAGNNTLVTLSRTHGRWRIDERGYPADFDRVRALLLHLAQARAIEHATVNPDHYRRLGVEALDSADASGLGIEISAGTRVFPRLIVGRSSEHRDGTFVRRDGEAQAWLTDRDIELARQPGDWLEPAVLDISADRLIEARLQQPEGTWFEVRREVGELVLEPNPDRRPPAHPDAFGQVMRALESLRLEDVLAASDVERPSPEDTFFARYRTGDGLQIDIDAWIAEGRHLLRFQAARAPIPGDAESADPVAEAELDREIDALNARFDGRVFIVANFHYADVTRTVSGLLAPAADPVGDTKSGASGHYDSLPAAEAAND